MNMSSQEFSVVSNEYNENCIQIRVPYRRVMQLLELCSLLEGEKDASDWLETWSKMR